VQLLLHDRKKERAKENLSIVEFLTPGTTIRAMYADEENEPAVRNLVLEGLIRRRNG
jgi:pre-mRNA-splicing factor 38B